MTRFYSYCQVSLTVVLLSCIQVNDVHVFQCLTFSDTDERESATEMLLDQKKKKEKNNRRKRNRKKRKKMELTEIFSVLFCS